MVKPIIAITMGDSAGVGPELALAMLREADGYVPVVFGEEAVLRLLAERRSVHFPFHSLKLSQWRADVERPTQPTIVSLEAIALEDFEPGKVNSATGNASYQFLTAAIDDALNSRVDGIVTAPIHKEALHLAGIEFPGHTEILAHHTNTKCYCMMLTSHEITCSLVTTHIGLNQVSEAISSPGILQTIQFSHHAMKRIRGRDPQIVVCGLNPHAGENGLFGNKEELRVILPAIQEARSIGIQVRGPVSPDTAFVPAVRESTDCFVCMYHDQGLIPFKALAFDSGVNVTLGLPIVRTSVDHGTALDIAWQGVVDLTSMRSAMDLAIKLCQS